MRIVQVCPYDITRPGGVARHVYDLSMELSRLGHEMTIIAPGPDRKSGVAEVVNPRFRIVHASKSIVVPFAKTSFEISYAGRADLRLIREVIAEEPDLFHFHTIWTPFLPWQIFGRIAAPAVATFHDVPPEGAVGRFQRVLYPLVLRKLLPRLEGAILASGVLKGHIDPTLARASCILPPCVDLTRFSPAVPPAMRFEDELVNILFLGRLEPRKGPLVLLRAYEILCREGLPVRLIVGGDGPERDKVTGFVSARNLPNVVFLGRVANADAPSWFSTADIFCAPSLYGEGFGIVLAEAMATGRPIVAADNAGYRMLLGKETGQCVVPPGDHVNLARALRSLILDEGLRDEMGEAGTAAARRYDVAEVAPKFLDFYQAALSDLPSMAG